MTKFLTWFSSKLFQGAFPYIVEKNFNCSSFDIIINVSDEWYPETESNLEHSTRYYWSPMNECKKDIGLNSIFGAMLILLHAEQNNLKVYLHCHACRNRSEIVKCCYYFMRTGKQLETEQNGFINRLVAACSRGYLPPRAEMESFLKDIQIQYNDKLEMRGGILDLIKIEHIHNF